MTGPLTTATMHGDITVGTIHVDIDLANAAHIHHDLLRGVANDSPALVVDLTVVGYLDSAGVRAFFELARELGVSRQRMGIVVPTGSPLRQLVKITRLDEVAVLAATVEECARALRQAGPHSASSPSPIDHH